MLSTQNANIYRNATIWINITETELIHLRYAKNVMIIAFALEELETMYSELTRKSLEVGIKSNLPIQKQKYQGL